MKRMTQIFYTAGFNLIELMITLIVLAVITAFAIPLYSEHVTQENRLEAKINLQKLASALEQYYVIHSTYKDASLNALHFPEKIVNNQYQLIIASASDASYVLEASPLNKQAQKDASCGNLTLDSSGVKGITGPGNVIHCW